MARPEVGEVAERVYAELGPYTVGDEATDWHLLKFVDAICEVLFERVHQLVSDRLGVVGWSLLLDPDLCPAPLLPFVGQFVGARLEPSMTEAQQRDAIRLPENFKRGTRAAMELAAKRTLTGTQTVLIEERHGGAYGLWVRTLAAETPASAATEAAVLSQKPGGLFPFTYEAITGQTWSDLIADHDDWADVIAEYPTWADVVSDLP